MTFEPHALRETLAEVVGRAPLLRNSTPAEVVEAWCADAETIHQAHHRVITRLEEAEWYRARLRGLIGSSSR